MCRACSMHREVGNVHKILVWKPEGNIPPPPPPEETRVEHTRYRKLYSLEDNEVLEVATCWAMASAWQPRDLGNSKCNNGV
jgi:hypothetical protein